MAEIVGKEALPFIPDDLSLPQFLLDVHHPSRPVRTKPQAWFIEETSGREIGLDEIRARTHGLANALKIRWNIGQDDVACLFSPNHVDYPVIIWAIHRLDGVVTTANPMYTSEELGYQLQLTKTRLLFVHPLALNAALDAARAAGLPQDRIVLLEPLPSSSCVNVHDLVKFGLRERQAYRERQLEPGEARTKLALLLFSSGTTGKPKAVMISHYALIANMLQVTQYVKPNDESVPLEQKRYRAGDVVLGALPMFHAYGLIMITFTGMFLGATVIVSPKFSLERMLLSIQQHRVTHLYLVPPQAILICKSPIVKGYDLSSIRFVGCGAAPVSPELTEQLSRTMPDPNALIGQAYGMTETATMITMPQLDKRTGTPGSAGFLLPGISARVVKADGSLAQFGELGELLLRSPAMALGYYNNPTATAETFVDGWLRTGDEVKIDERGEVFVVDRIKELIKVRAFQVAPSELEGLLFDHPDVSDVCVVAIPDDYSGELPFAFIVLRPDIQARVKGDLQEPTKVKEGLMKYVSDHKTHFKWLAGVEFIDAIPKNPSGKLLRRVLREQARSMLKSGQLSIVAKAKL
ncbi:amp dependent CoA ligase [Dichomitus squalens LYAD-421 SS1]|uniref:Amp dependent CoA ligase n=1 Tax=Dichomitus squalens (strain LYAD-421) TaxID=732165 RepID=R7SZU5_DICSQ|nr:amp dependent CoA ligase [Dichomitus squalens LYAD-421 SS1]EJF61689.1 amp dependent CoA ligase [Dichomitus squalens LYAD-421 SS1]